MKYLVSIIKKNILVYGLIFGLGITFAVSLRFADDLFGLFPSMQTNQGSVYFHTAGNDFGGSIHIDGLEIINNDGVSFEGEDISCGKKIKGIYFNNQRGKRLWPLDQDSLIKLQSLDSSYDMLTVNGGLYTNCASGRSGISVAGQITHNRSGTEFKLIAGVQMNEDNTYTMIYTNSLQYSGGVLSGKMFDSYGGVADVFSIGDETNSSLPFITTWQTDKAGVTDNHTIRIPGTGDGYNYNIFWQEDGNPTNSGFKGPIVQNTYDLVFPSAGIYKVEISGEFPRIYFNNTGDRKKIISIDQWGDIERKSMEKAFYGAYNISGQAIDVPNLSNVKDLSYMFAYAGAFNQEIGDRSLKNVTNTSFMFEYANNFNQNISGWDTSSVTNMESMFSHAPKFNKYIGSWDTSSVQNMQGMFNGAEEFNQDIGSWNVSGVTNMSYMFRAAHKFNQDIGPWIVSNVTDMRAMFHSTYDFNQDISEWKVGSVENMSFMFFGANKFNKPIGDWDVSRVTDMVRMFLGANAFNQNIGDWNVSNVINMSNMLDGTALSIQNYDALLTGWSIKTLIPDVHFGAVGVKYCSGYNARQHIKTTYNWTIIDGGNSCSLYPFSFNDNLEASNSVISGYIDLTNATGNIKATLANDIFISEDSTGVPYEDKLILDIINTGNLSENISSNNDVLTALEFGSVTKGLKFSKPVQLSMPVDLADDLFVSMVVYHSGVIKTGVLSNDLGSNCSGGVSSAPSSLFKVVDGEITFTTCSASTFIANNPNAFITTWNTNNTGVTSNTGIRIPGIGGGYNYNVSWEEVGNPSNSGKVLSIKVDTYDLTLPSSGTYQVAIIGSFPRIYFDKTGDSQKIISIDQRGDINWTSMHRAFAGAYNLSGQASDTPNLSQVTDLTSMFREAASFDQNIGSWDVSNVVKMRLMFDGATSFNQDISGWNVSNVIDMYAMFNLARNFNQYIGSWDVSKVTDMYRMLRGAEKFNQDIGDWEVGNVITMESMFKGANAFNQNISGWDTSKVTNMYEMFAFASSFHQYIGNWDVSKVTNMERMFRRASGFNQDISKWDVSKVTNMARMFSFASSFNQDISTWIVSGVTNMGYMFESAEKFNQNIGNWDIINVINMSGMLSNTALSIPNYDAILTGRNNKTLKNNVPFGSQGNKYCLGESARQSIISGYNWTITDAGKSCGEEGPTNLSLTNNGPASEGSGITFTASGVSAGTISYQFYEGAGCTGAVIRSWNINATYQTGLGEPGTYGVSFKAKGGNDIESEECSNVSTGRWNNVAPTSSNISYSTGVGKNITFVATATDPGGSSVQFTYGWYVGNSCGEGIISTGSTYTTGKTVAGTMTLSYRVTDPQGSGSNCAIATGTWSDESPTNLSLTNNGPASEGSGIMFTASGVSVGPINYQFYEGAGCTGTPIMTWSTIATYQKPFAGLSPYGVSFKAKGGNDIESACSSVSTGTWNNVAPTSNNISYSTGVGKNITFVATATDPGGSGVQFTYGWYVGNSCGGGIISTGSTYTTGKTVAGTMTLSYRVTDPQGSGSNCAIATGIWSNEFPTNLSLTNNGPATEGSGIIFTASGVSAGTIIYQFYEGAGCTGTVIRTWDTIATYQKLFAGLSPYGVSFKATGNGVESECSATSIGRWNNVAPTSNNISYSTGVGKNITFVATATDPGGSSIPFTHRWYLGNSCGGGTISTGSTYTTGKTVAGTMTLSYKVTDPQGSGSNCAIATGTWSDESITPPTGGGGGGGGGGSNFTRDNCCINGKLPGGNAECEDLSDNYYDGTCVGGYHGSADICGVNQSKYTDELKLGYLYAYKNGITTLCPIEDADLDGYLYRNHFAKMISEYAINVLGKKPEIGKKGCEAFDDIKNETKEMKKFIKTACELNLMGMRADGKTTMPYFDPTLIVTRAEFGTVFSRLLFGEKYNIPDESLIYKNEGYWYKDHLNALKDNGIMTKIDGEWPKYKEKRGWAMLMMFRADKYGLFAGKIPALLGVKSLLN